MRGGIGLGGVPVETADVIHVTMVGVVFEEGVGLELGEEVEKLKPHCKSMEGLNLASTRQAVPHHHLEVVEVRKASHPC